MNHLSSIKPHFEDGDSDKNIRYVIARYLKWRKRWVYYTTYESIEVAKERIKELRDQDPNMDFGLFEEIRAYTINQLAEEYL